MVAPPLSFAARRALLPRLAAASVAAPLAEAAASHHARPFFDGVVDPPLLQLAEAEELAPRLGERLASGALTAEPTIAARLANAHRTCVARTLVMDHALRAAGAALAAREIPALCLKGAALVRTALPPGARSMADVDLLVPPARWKEATGALLAAGARVHDLYERPFTAAHDYALPLLTREGVVLELHRFLCERPAFTPPYEGPDSLFVRARPHADGVLIPEPEDLFLGLAIHAAHHGLCLPFRAVVDGLALASAGALRPAVVLGRAVAWRARRATAVFVALLLRFGLPPVPWRPLLAELGLAAGLAQLASDAPWPEQAAHLPHEGLSRRLALLDTPTRKLALVAQRLALRLADGAGKRLLGS